MTEKQILRVAYSVLLAVTVAACAPSTPAATGIPTAAPVADSATPLPGDTVTPTETATPIPTDTPIPTIAPTYVESLRAKVIVEGRLSCRFGPGAPYLYKFTFAKGTLIELLGRMEYSDWVLAQAIGGDNRCWVNGGPEYLEITGDVTSLAPVDPHIVLAWSPYYTNGMSGVTATRDGDVVTVGYNGLALRAGDDSEQTPYVLEAWVCQGGEFVFTAEGSYGFAIEVVDEPGCVQTSHGRVAAAEKHGYTPFVEVVWPTATPTP